MRSERPRMHELCVLQPTPSAKPLMSRLHLDGEYDLLVNKSPVHFANRQDFPTPIISYANAAICQRTIVRFLALYASVLSYALWTGLPPLSEQTLPLDSRPSSSISCYNATGSFSKSQTRRSQQEPCGRKGRTRAEDRNSS